MSQTNTAPAQGQGLQLNKKTVIFITSAILAIMVLVGVLTQVIPRGEYRTDESGAIIALDENGNSTYREMDFRLPFWKTFTAPIEVFGSSDAMTGVAIILFIVLIGGTFLLLDKSNVLNYLMAVIVRKFAKRKYLLLPVVIFVMMLLSSVVGILEESITITPLCVAICLALGWDSLVGISISVIAIAFGYSAATFNPFNVVLVQSMAGLPIFSGLGYRILVFIGIYALLTGYVILYAKKVEKNPQKSMVWESDAALREKYASALDPSLAENPLLKKATSTFVGCIAGVPVLAVLSFAAQRIEAIPASVREYISYAPMVGMAVLFTVGGLRAAYITGIRGKALSSGFAQGARTIAPIAPLIIFVMAITFLMREGKIVDTILYHLYNGISGFSAIGSLLLIAGFVLILEFFVGSGTAKAFLVMPLILPLAHMIGITEQTIVLAFTIADGFGNILYPTSGVMLIAIGIVGVSYGKYMRYMWKLFLAEFAFSALMLAGAVMIGYS